MFYGGSTVVLPDKHLWLSVKVILSYNTPEICLLSYFRFIIMLIWSSESVWAKTMQVFCIFSPSKKLSILNMIQCLSSTVVLQWFYSGSTVVHTVVLRWFYSGSTVVEFSGSTVVLRWFYIIYYITYLNDKVIFMLWYWFRYYFTNNPI